MSSTHSDFCRKELREKVVVKVRFFLGLSQLTRPIFVVSGSEKRSERFYIGAKISAHEPIFTPIFGYDKKSVRVRWA